MESNSVNVTNILEVSTLDLAFWVAAHLLDTKVPSYGINTTFNVQNDILPLLSVVANKISLTTEFYVLVVGATPTATSVRTTGQTTTKEHSESLGRKKDILYRTLQTLESTRETLSRMMTGIRDSNHTRS